MLRRHRSLLLVFLLILLLPAGKQGLAQERTSLFFRATGHHLTDDHGFLSFWRSHGGEPILGMPISEPLEENGRLVQYLERARLEYHPELPTAILLGRLGAERTRWRRFPPAPPLSPSRDVVYLSETQHTLGPPFYEFWHHNGGLTVFGYPISEPLWESIGGGFYRVQYFERARFEHHPAYAGSDREIQIGRLGWELARARNLDVSPVAARGDAVAIGKRLPTTPQMRVQTPAQAQDSLSGATSSPEAATASPALLPPSPPQSSEPQGAGRLQPEVKPKSKHSLTGKHIEIDLSAQWLYAYDNGLPVYNAPVATGKDGFNTPAGNFAIYAKLPLQTMRGSLNGETWDVPDVPHVMYIHGDIALHGTYWHNLFGTGVRISHGCINLRLPDAAWLYEWAPTGTPVDIHY